MMQSLKPLSLGVVLVVGLASVPVSGQSVEVNEDQYEGLYDEAPPGPPRGRGADRPASLDPDLAFGDQETDAGFADRPFDRPPPMSAQELESAQWIVARLYPELGERLQQLHQQDPERYRRTVEHRLPRVRYLVDLRWRDEKMFELRMADVELGRYSVQLADQLRAAEAAGDLSAVHRLRTELERKVTQHFDVRHEIREREIQTLKHRLEVMEDRLDDRDDDRDDLIEQRLNELAGPDW